MNVSDPRSWTQMTPLTRPPTTSAKDSSAENPSSPPARFSTSDGRHSLRKSRVGSSQPLTGGTVRASAGIIPRAAKRVTTESSRSNKVRRSIR